ncbi:MAG TPA: helix-hairpin-helix domain-containing protein [Longimicrobiaceae bacterium]
MRTTRQERTALGVAALLLAMGAVVQRRGTEAPPAEWSAAAAEGGGEADRLLERAGKAAEREARASTPLMAGERLDPNTASATELERLPRVGPGVARRIVEWRASHGPFRTLADLDSVPGVGAALLREAAPHLALPAAPVRAASARPGLALSSSAPSPAAAGPLDLNAATAEELERLPGIGPALARRIVERRASAGRFRSPAELESVPGIGAKTLARIAPLVRASP